MTSHGHSLIQIIVHLFTVMQRSIWLINRLDLLIIKVTLFFISVESIVFVTIIINIFARSANVISFAILLRYSWPMSCYFSYLHLLAFDKWSWHWYLMSALTNIDAVVIHSRLILLIWVILITAFIRWMVKSILILW